MQEIIDLFKALSRVQQDQVLKKLQVIAAKNNPVVELAQFTQKRYGQNAIRTNTSTGTPFAPETTVEWNTPWGMFSASASNGAEAAKLAAEKAMEAIPED